MDRRLFQEKVLRAESDFHERELLRIQKERELNEIRRQHEKEIYLLRKKMHEASPQQTAGADRSEDLQVRACSAFDKALELKWVVLVIILIYL